MLILFAGVLALSGFSSAKAQSVEYVVISIEGTIEGITPGQILAEGNRIEIPDGVEVHLLAKSGETIILNGPISGTVTNDKDEPEGEKALSTISRLLFKDREFSEVIGGTRSVSLDASAWTPVLSEKGPFCISNAKPELLRQDSSQDTLLVLESDDSKSQEILWPAGSNILSLIGRIDTTQPDYKITVGNTGSSTRIHILDTSTKSSTEQLAWMAEKKCFQQAYRLLSEQASR